jgi:hypothetical protein
LSWTRAKGKFMPWGLCSESICFFSEKECNKMPRMWTIIYG